MSKINRDREKAKSRKDDRVNLLYDDEPSYSDTSLEDLIELGYYRRGLHEELKSLPVGVTEESMKVVKEKLGSYYIPYEGSYLKSVPRGQDKLPDVLNKEDQRYIDPISFYASIIISCAKKDEYRDDIISAEKKIFRARLHEMKGRAKEILNILEQRIDSKFKLEQFYDEKAERHEIPFELIFDIIDAKDANLNKGLVVIDENGLETLCADYFQRYLEKLYGRIMRKSMHMESFFGLIAKMYDERVAIFETPIGFEGLALDTISYLHQLFPPCMRNMHDFVSNNHMLMHDGRLQYTSFLKGAGMSLNDSIMYFKKEYTKKVDLSRFDREYAYYIKHVYGKVGSGTDYNAYSCEKIINSGRPGPGTCHGCPFRSGDKEYIRQTIAKYKGVGKENLKGSVIESIIAKATDKHYKSACEDLYKSLFPDSSDFRLHPNTFYLNAFNYKKENEENNKS